MGLFNSVQFLCSEYQFAELEVRAGGNFGNSLLSQRCTFFVIPRGAGAHIGLKKKIGKKACCTWVAWHMAHVIGVTLGRAGSIS